MRLFPPFFIPQGSVKVPNTGLDYSETEQESNIKWIDGKSIFQKTINFGSMPNNMQKVVAHNIVTIEEVIAVEGYAQDSGAANAQWIQLTFVFSTTLASTVFVNATNVVIKAIGNLTTHEECFITIYYTKV